MRDVNHSDALRLKVVHYTEQFVDFALRQCRRRLVENENFTISRHRLRDFDHLLFTYGKPAELDFRIDVYSYTIENRAGLFYHIVVFDKQPRSDLSADKNVLRDGQIVHHVEFLVNHAYPESLRFADVFDGVRLAEIKNFPGVRLVDSRKHFHKRRFSRAVLSDERVNFAFPQIEVYSL